MPRKDLIKAALLLLLGINAAIQAATGRVSETLDAFAWFTLLLLFELETRGLPWTLRSRAALALNGLRLLATGAIVWSAMVFVEEQEWLDAANGWLWIGVVILLELEFRVPVLIARWRRAAVAAAILLYSALTVVAAAWWVQGEWFDGYDAVLWITAFVLLEMDLLGRIPGSSKPVPKGISK
ncbi:MAG: hypothetical protein RLZZ445_469 [Pseudomonadota bacterium]|jgi:hypothetical protein